MELNYLLKIYLALVYKESARDNAHYEQFLHTFSLQTKEKCKQIKLK